MPLFIDLKDTQNEVFTPKLPIKFFTESTPSDNILIWRCQTLVKCCLSFFSPWSIFNFVYYCYLQLKHLNPLIVYYGSYFCNFHLWTASNTLKTSRGQYISGLKHASLDSQIFTWGFKIIGLKFQTSLRYSIILSCCYYLKM